MSNENYSTLLGISPLLTNERVSDSLSAWFREKVAFTHWEYKTDTDIGDHFLSKVIFIRIYGTTVDNRNKHIQVVLKTIPKNKSMRLTFRTDDFFRNEINFYEKCLPALLKFQAKKNLRNPFDSYTKLFLAYSDGINDVIAIEDASIHNFRAASRAMRQQGIDYEHCKLTLKVLAQHHAMSFAMRDQEPEEFDRICKVIAEVYYDESNWDWYQKFWARVCGIAVDAVEKEYPNTKYVDKIKEFAAPESYRKLIEAVRDKTNCVICHGDTWTNNFLYKHESKRPVEARIIDFQLTRCASPVLDVSVVIYASTAREMRLNYYEDLLKNYYEVLSNQITELGSDVNRLYPWDTFMAEIKKYSYFGLAFSFESTPATMLRPEDAVITEKEGDEKRNIDDYWQLQPIETREGRLREADNIVHCVDYGYI